MVLWKNWDGTLLEADADLYSGDMPSYDGPVPVKEPDEDGEYAFAGWSPKIGGTTTNIVYTARFPYPPPYLLQRYSQG